MAEVFLPHNVEYEIENRASVADLVSALVGAEVLLREVGPVLEACVDGLTVERIHISVRRISQDSPLRIAFYTALVLAFQKDLEKAVPAIANQLFGIHVPDSYNTVLTLAFCLLLYYGVESIYNQVNKVAFSKRIREQLDDVAKELSGECSVPEERIKKIIEKRYGKSRMRILGHSALSFFRPSKNQHNAPVKIGHKLIDSETVATVPSDAEIMAAQVPEIARPLNNITIQLHAQDVDRARQGWAGIVPEISSKRLRVEIEPPLKPDQVYMKRTGLHPVPRTPS